MADYEGFHTPHFSERELTQTKTGLPNRPSFAFELILKQTAMNAELLRHVLGEPLIVTSAWRGPRVNDAVGGSPNSAHAQGHAIDFYCRNLTPWETVDIISKSWLYFDQLINEQEKGVVHISWAPTFRQQVLTQQGARFVSGNIKGKTK